MKDIQLARECLREKFEKLDKKREILRAPEFRALFDAIKTYPEADRAAYGKAVNELRLEVEEWVNEFENHDIAQVKAIDVTAPWDGSAPPEFLLATQGSIHPL